MEWGGKVGWGWYCWDWLGLAKVGPRIGVEVEVRLVWVSLLYPTCVYITFHISISYISCMYYVLSCIS